jgi:hypothetical protein
LPQTSATKYSLHSHCIEIMCCEKPSFEGACWEIWHLLIKLYHVTIKAEQELVEYLLD